MPRRCTFTGKTHREGERIKFEGKVFEGVIGPKTDDPDGIDVCALVDGAQELRGEPRGSTYTADCAVCGWYVTVEKIRP